MILKQLRLKNFRQFKGEQVITFPVYEDKNVIVVLGNNTAGKTTLIQAFYWVLYGKTNFKNKETLLLNLEEANSMKPGEKKEVMVSLILVDRGIEYTITRRQQYEHVGTRNLRVSNSKVEMEYKDEQGRICPILKEIDIIDSINKILPEELADYFFFDGERIGNLAKRDKDSKKELSKAVRSILGLAEIEEAIKHLAGNNKNSVLKMVRENIDDKEEQRLKILKNEINDLEEKRSNLEKEIEDIENEIRESEIKIKEIEEYIRTNQQILNFQITIDNNIKRINDMKEGFEKDKKRFKGLIQEKTFGFLLIPIVKKIENELKGFASSIDVVPKISGETIDYIIKRGECLCGTKILEGTNEYNRLVELKEYLPPKYIGVAINNFLTEAYFFMERDKNFFKELKELYGEMLNKINIINELEDENEKIKQLISSKRNMKIYIQEKEKYENNKKDKELLKDKKLKELGIIEKEIENKSKEIENLSEKSEKNKFVMLCLRYVDYLTKSLKDFYKSKEEEIREKLNEKVNDIFSKMYHGEDRKILIDSSYDYQLITEYLSDQFKDKADESRGLETIMSFAFIGGIIQLAREKITNSSKSKLLVEEDELNIELELEPYPLVMDAPFSNVDEIHVENVSRILPEIAEQVIMFIMNKDWNYAQKVLADKVAAKYELEKINETHTIIREVK